jgi:HlyD family secretion protein
VRDDRPIPTPLPQRIEHFRERRLPLIVWSVCALICVWMMSARIQHFEYIGLAQALQYEVSADATGRLENLTVNVYDRVQAGDVLARLNDDEIAARLERSHATIRQLTAELGVARTRMLSTGTAERAGWATDLRRFQADEEDRRLAALDLRITIETDEIELERLALELKRSEPLLGAGMIGQNEYERIRQEHDGLRTRVDEMRFLLAQTEEEARTAMVRRQDFERSLPSEPEPEPLLRPLQEAIEIENRRLEEIQARRAATILRSPVDGQVSQVLCRKGQTVVPGEPILTVTELTVGEILAFVNEADAPRVRADDAAVVASVTRPGARAESFVVRVAPSVDVMPQRLWRDPALPEYGRAVVTASVPALDLTPGDILSVRFPDMR